MSRGGKNKIVHQTAVCAAEQIKKSGEGAKGLVGQGPAILDRAGCGCQGLRGAGDGQHSLNG